MTRRTVRASPPTAKSHERGIATLGLEAAVMSPNAPIGRMSPSAPIEPNTCDRGECAHDDHACPGCGQPMQRRPTTWIDHAEGVTRTAWLLYCPAWAGEPNRTCTKESM